MTLDAINKALVQNALDDIKEADRVLAVRASAGARAKPTVSELNDIMRRLENAQAFLKAVLRS